LYATKKNIGKSGLQSIQEEKESNCLEARFLNGEKVSGLRKTTILVTMGPVSNIMRYIN
jgi:hypothetical protein